MKNYFSKRFGKAWQLADSLLSRGLNNERVREEIKDIREISCHGSEELGITPCEAREESKKFPGSHICGACNCGDFGHTQITNLSEDHYSKLDYPRVVCPKRMPGFMNFIPLTISENNMRKKLIEETFGVEYLVELTARKENPGGQEVE